MQHLAKRFRFNHIFFDQFEIDFFSDNIKGDLLRVVAFQSLITNIHEINNSGTMINIEILSGELLKIEFNFRVLPLFNA